MIQVPLCGEELQTLFNGLKCMEVHIKLTTAEKMQLQQLQHKIVCFGQAEKVADPLPWKNAVPHPKTDTNVQS